MSPSLALCPQPLRTWGCFGRKSPGQGKCCGWFSTLSDTSLMQLPLGLTGRGGFKRLQPNTSNWGLTVLLPGKGGGIAGSWGIITSRTPRGIRAECRYSVAAGAIEMQRLVQRFLGWWALAFWCDSERRQGSCVGRGQMEHRTRIEGQTPAGAGQFTAVGSIWGWDESVARVWTGLDPSSCS